MPVPFVRSADRVRGIGRFITECGYSETALQKMGLTSPVWRGSTGLALLEYKIPDNPKLAVLARLFHFGEALASQTVSALFPADVIEAMLDCRMIRRDGEMLAAECMLTHLGDLILACDPARRAEGEDCSNLVLSVNPTTILLERCIIASGAAEVLDLCTGCGALALMLARSSRAVTATDINPRAVDFTKFNSALNGITNVSTRCGDRFEAVQNETFDLIIANPPFFLSPRPRLLFTDNPMELDSFVEGLARAAPAFLKEGGFFQMLCEWVECGAEPWRQRLSDWFDKSGCDVVTLRGYQIAPADYILKRAAEMSGIHGEETADSMRQRMEYFERKQVRKIYGGLVTMRRRAATNWRVFDEVDDMREKPIGGYLSERFAAQDVLALHDGKKLLTTRPRVAKGVRLIEEALAGEGAWKPARRYLERPGGISRRLAIEADVANLIGRFDGKQTLDSIVAGFAENSKLPAAGVVDIALQIVATLASRGLIDFSESEG